MKNNKGFTLVELLAVMTLLSIIILVIAPTVLDLINENKTETSVLNARKYIEAVRLELTNIGLEDNKKSFTSCQISDTKGNLVCDITESVPITFKGEAPKSGTIIVDDFAIVEASLVYDETVGKILYTETGATIGMLPKEYTQLEYIESTGTQYIDTDVEAKLGLDFYTRFSISSDTTTGVQFGGVKLSNQQLYSIVGLSSNGTNFAFRFNDTFYESTIPIEKNKIYNSYTKFSKDSQLLKIDDSLIYKQTINSNFSSDTTITIFGYNQDGEVIRENVSWRLYSFKILENNNVIRYFVPVYNTKEEESGLYDIVNGKFYKNSGEGTFGLGNSL